jgi:hypothetical protein
VWTRRLAITVGVALAFQPATRSLSAQVIDTSRVRYGRVLIDHLFERAVPAGGQEVAGVQRLGGPPRGTYTFYVPIAPRDSGSYCAWAISRDGRFENLFAFDVLPGSRTPVPVRISTSTNHEGELARNPVTLAVKVKRNRSHCEIGWADDGVLPVSWAPGPRGVGGGPVPLRVLVNRGQATSMTATIVGEQAPTRCARLPDAGAAFDYVCELPIPTSFAGAEVVVQITRFVVADPEYLTPIRIVLPRDQ